MRSGSCDNMTRQVGAIPRENASECSGKESVTPRPSTETTLVPASAEDKPVLAVFMRQLREDDPEEGPYDEALSRPAMSGLLADPSFGRVWLIRHGAETAGYVVLTLCYSVELGGRYAFVDELFVARDFRSRGIGGSVLRLVEAEAKALGVRALSLEVTRSNASARRLYERNGFVARGHELMTRRLDAPD